MLPKFVKKDFCGANNVEQQDKGVGETQKDINVGTTKKVNTSEKNPRKGIKVGDKKEKTKAVGTKLERRKARLKNLKCPWLTSNPNLPTKAVKAQSEANFNLNVSRYKAYRALREAQTKLQGDYMDQYLHLRDYIKELQGSNPNTTVRVLTGNQDPNAEAVQFKRIYICLGGLKQGFKELGRDLIGVDGVFMKAPAHGQLLTAVGIDSNNGIYPLAYAMVEQENYNAWCWFFDCLRDDLEMDRTSNFTFMSDRQKGLIHVVEKVFPCAEHRFCLRHIHENMKKKWGGLVYKKQLWKCASATTVPQFEKAMLEMKGLNAACWKYLADIQPKHWARSHFTGRALSDVLLNNMCEVLNKCLLEARDKPIITALEYVREYLMRRIAVVKVKFSKADGHLTPTVTKLFETIKEAASQYTVIWGGDDQYQVSGPHND
ncbi:uncharacterized protein [Rutidosis leptorrhynchoides]|uniref:uncharacterized protein n=1 Tax=Rutidosis leptorrhynchoides TaxID=125765 RepID=UPI003A99C38E